MKRFVMLIIWIIVAVSMFTGCNDAQKIKLPDVILSTDTFQITVPDELYNKIDVSTEYNSIHIHHKASQEAGYLGHIVSINVFSTEIFKEIPCYELICESDGEFYVAEYPSDVQADAENEQTMKEYFEIFEQMPEIIKNTFEIIK